MQWHERTDSLDTPLDTIPPQIACAADYERLAAHRLPPDIHAYFAGGSGAEITLRNNRTALDALTLCPRVLADFDSANTATTLLGLDLPHPVMLAPVAYQKLAHPEGETATATGAEAMNTVMTASTLSHCALEDIARASLTPKWFQLYLQPDPAITLSLLERAERAGYAALVVTVDTPVNALRLRAQRAGFVMPDTLVEANLADYPAPEHRPLSPDQSPVFDGFMADAPNWRTIAGLREHTRLPVLLKGVAHPDDACRAFELGIDGLIVSNHGGRALDGMPASIELLPAIRRACGNDAPLLLDSGIRSGSDVFRALALGADAVMIGRLQVYALAVAGALGVAHMLRCLVTELEVTMALAGCPTLGAIRQQGILSHWHRN